MCFEQFKQNPEEFIIKSARLINEQKATLIVQHITYSKIEGDEGVYSTDIFTEPTLKGKLGINTMIATKVFMTIYYMIPMEKKSLQHN